MEIDESSKKAIDFMAGEIFCSSMGVTPKSWYEDVLTKIFELGYKSAELKIAEGQVKVSG